MHAFSPEERVHMCMHLTLVLTPKAVQAKSGRQGTPPPSCHCPVRQVPPCSGPLLGFVQEHGDILSLPPELACPSIPHASASVTRATNQTWVTQFIVRAPSL